MSEPARRRGRRESVRELLENLGQARVREIASREHVRLAREEQAHLLSLLRDLGVPGYLAARATLRAVGERQTVRAITREADRQRQLRARARSAVTSCPRSLVRRGCGASDTAAASERKEAQEMARKKLIRRTFEEEWLEEPGDELEGLCEEVGPDNDGGEEGEEEEA